MSVRVVLTCVVAATTLLAAGCGGDGAPAPERAAGPDAYVRGAEDLLHPVGELVSALREGASAPARRAPARADLEPVVARAGAALERFRAVDPGDGALRAQAARMAERYERVVAAMPAAVDALAAGDTGPVLAGAAAPFLDAVDSLAAGAEPGR